ncbi:MAG: hypothetical protein Q9179_000797 [Wetmoreana sp. 5 TL-2023]
MILSTRVWLVLLFILHIALSLRCYPPPAGNHLPTLGHCQELVLRMLHASFMPHVNEPKTYGRGLQNEGAMESLPKIYWLGGLGPSTCAVHLDADNNFPDARETFRFQDLALAARKTVNVCLEGRRYLGSDSLGFTHHVVAKIVRAPSALWLQSSEGLKVLSAVPEKGELLATNTMSNGSYQDTERSVSM